jgi:hypothetical protein
VNVGEVGRNCSVFACALVFRQCAWPAKRRARKIIGARAKVLRWEGREEVKFKFSELKFEI